MFAYVRRNQNLKDLKRGEITGVDPTVSTTVGHRAPRSRCTKCEDYRGIGPPRQTLEPLAEERESLSLNGAHTAQRRGAFTCQQHLRVGHHFQSGARKRERERRREREREIHFIQTSTTTRQRQAPRGSSPDSLLQTTQGSLGGYLKSQFSIDLVKFWR